MRQQGKTMALLVLPALLLSWGPAFANMGPSSPAAIGDGRTPAEFAQADAYCRDVARARVGTTPDEAATRTTAGSTVVGGLLGAGLGAGIGAAAGSPGKGAAIGAGAGLLGGLAYGASQGSAAAAGVQQRYDAEYYQCMHQYGHRVPGAAYAPRPQGYGPPPPAAAPQYGPTAGPADPPAWNPGPPEPARGAPAPPPPAVSGMPAPAPAGPAACRPTGKYVKTAEGFKEICE